MNALLSGRTNIGHDFQEVLGTGFGPEATGDFGLDFNHAQIALRLIVVKRNVKALCKQAYGCLVIP